MQLHLSNLFKEIGARYTVNVSKNGKIQSTTTDARYTPDFTVCVFLHYSSFLHRTYQTLLYLICQSTS